MERRRGEQWPATIASLADHERERGADERDQVISGRAGAREKEKARLTGGVRRSAWEGWARHVGTRKMGRVGQAGEEWARGRERRGEGLDRIRPSRGGISLFSFSFPISFYLTPFSFKQKFI
jgi:hypothetical protein